MCAKGNLLAGLKASSPFGRCPTLYPGSSAAAIYIDYEKTLGTRSRSDQVSFKVTLEQYVREREHKVWAFSHGSLCSPVSKWRAYSQEKSPD